MESLILKPRVTTPKMGLNFTFGSPRNGILNQAIGNRLTSIH